MRAVLRAIYVTGLVAGCHGNDPASPDAAVVYQPTANPARDVTDTKLAFDVTALTGTATITLAPSTDPGATLEIGDLVIDSTRLAGVDLARSSSGGAKAKLDLALPPSDQPLAVDFTFHYKLHEGFTGASSLGFTFLWPYFCGNLFPCHSQPADGTTFMLDVTGVPAGKQAVFPTSVPSLAPAYQIAWTIDAYTELPLGMTTAGTQVSVWYRPNELTAAQNGTAHLVAAFDWFEKTIGAYRFGSKVGSVAVAWPAGAYGGMEHHPRWHISAPDLADEVTNVHESAHGWFGDGIRIGCWEDFVLSEGTVSYLAARALDVVAPSVGAQAWTSYASDLSHVPASDPVWPQTCGTVDVLTDNLYTNAPYMRGAFFYRAVALKVGAEKVDMALHAFYAAHAGQTGHMSEMLQTLKDVTGYDPTTCADMWLKSTTKPAIGPCP